MIAWVKLATAGGSPYTCPILEVAVVLTDDLLAEQTTFTVPVKPHRKWKGWDDRMAPKVKAQHRRSGLSRVIASGMNIAEVDAACAQIAGRRGGSILGSVNPAVTRKFLRSQMPAMLHRLSTEDMSLVRLRREAHKPAPSHSKPLRALPGARAMVSEAKVLLAALGRLDPALVPVETPEKMESII